MVALHEVFGRSGHIVAEVVEAELVVCAESDVGIVSLAACCGVRFVLVDAVDRQTVEHIKRSHPFGVALRQVVVDSDHMHAVACKRVEEYGQCRYKCLTFSGCHLGDFAAVKHYTAD